MEYYWYALSLLPGADLTNRLLAGVFQETPGKSLSSRGKGSGDLPCCRGLARSARIYLTAYLNRIPNLRWLT
jgi:hypothetical protein